MSSDSNNVSGIHWDAQGQPASNTFDDIYFSKENGLEESRYVFLQHNQLHDRFSKLTDHQLFTIGETGFGTGLNFLACWQLWHNTAPPECRLHYIAVEKHPLRPDELTRALALWSELSDYSQQLLAAYRNNYIGSHRSSFQRLEFGNIRLSLIIADAALGLSALFANPHNDFASPYWCQENKAIDAWFLDGFAPAKNPDMWSESLFNTIEKFSKPTTTVATFTAAGHVKRNLMRISFDVRKVPGFGKKREMLTGYFKGSTEEINQPLYNTALNHEKPVKSITPWAVSKHHQVSQHSQKIAVIGAGMAGCHMANALAKRGFDVTVIERNAEAATETSGNLQGVVYAKLSTHQDPLGEFNLSCLLYAQQFYQAFWQTNPDAGQACGMMQLSTTPKLENAHQHIAQYYSDTHWINYLTAEQASHIAQVKLQHPALFFSHCGWLQPASLCQWLLKQNTISLVTNTHIQSLHRKASRWQLNGYQNGQAWQQLFDQVVIANANDARTFEQTQWVPTKPIRGQVSHIPSQTTLETLNTVICSQGYIAPATNIEGRKIHAIGASFNLHDASPQLTMGDHHHNIQELTKIIPDIVGDINLPAQENGRVGFRCSTPDYLPLAGPAPDKPLFQNTFKGLSHNAKQYIPQPGDYLPNLYLNIGHGSRGLTYTPLVAEILASRIAGEPPPVIQMMADNLNPARFLIRELIRG